MNGVAQAQTLYTMLAAERERGDLPEVIELVPAARTVLAVARPTAAGRDCLHRLAAMIGCTECSRRRVYASMESRTDPPQKTGGGAAPPPGCRGPC